MGLPKRRCPNCGDTEQHFRRLHDAERIYALGRVRGAEVDKYRRCTRQGCVRVQSYFNWRAGFDLPEEFRTSAEPAGS